MNNAFNGLGMGLATLSRLSNAQTRSISAENFTGAKGQGGMATEGTGADAGRELGQGWKLSPSIHIDAASTVTLADIDGPGAIQQIWLTVHPTFWRRLVIRFYWDNEETPSVEVPIGDADQRPRLTVGQAGRQLHVFAQEMHVRRNRDGQYVVRQHERRLHFVACVIRRNAQVA